VLSVRDTQEDIKRIAEKHKAKIVLWGSYTVSKDVVDVTANYEILHTDLLDIMREFPKSVHTSLVHSRGYRGMLLGGNVLDRCSDSRLIGNF
jgi:hypothetical protein